MKNFDVQFVPDLCEIFAPWAVRGSSWLWRRGPSSDLSHQRRPWVRTWRYQDLKSTNHRQSVSHSLSLFSFRRRWRAVEGRGSRAVSWRVWWARCGSARSPSTPGTPRGTWRSWGSWSGREQVRSCLEKVHSPLTCSATCDRRVCSSRSRRGRPPSLCCPCRRWSRGTWSRTRGTPRIPKCRTELFAYVSEIQLSLHKHKPSVQVSTLYLFEYVLRGVPPHDDLQHGG